MPSPKTRRPRGETLSTERIRKIVGDIEDIKVAQILATGATVQDLEAAVAWFSGKSDITRDAGHPVTGTAARVFNILKTEEMPEDERA